MSWWFRRTGSRDRKLRSEQRGSDLRRPRPECSLEHLGAGVERFFSQYVPRGGEATCGVPPRGRDRGVEVPQELRVAFARIERSQESAHPIGGIDGRGTEGEGSTGRDLEIASEQEMVPRPVDQGDLGRSEEVGQGRLRLGALPIARVRNDLRPEPPDPREQARQAGPEGVDPGIDLPEEQEIDRPRHVHRRAGVEHLRVDRVGQPER